ncbi:hypothetical protein [Virgisporangium aurantiacum]|uniref:PKD domain-containing protein n=1 Tax=Virgisporangium aurantiacum TaxID=175570 RepID=A0A8J3ZMM7_9ACTN|nr:hypothetical protein [Virgisporangium aurantiacum]GIJ64388.1 hypothetical protein Vau01_119040 [Virgisporangium aurantiacum]
MLTRLIAFAAATAAAVLVSPAEMVRADPYTPVPVYCDQSPTPGCTVRARTPGQDRNVGTAAGGSQDCHDATGAVVPCYIEGRGSVGSDGCYYQHVDNGPPPAGSGGPGGWYVRSCHEARNFGPLGMPLDGTLVWLPNGAVPISPEVLARQAISRLNLPTPVIRINPAPPASQIVSVPSWFWVESASWGVRSATASVPGLAVTATARATKLVFDTGDRTTVTCDGPGTPWRAGMDATATSPCGHTYQQAGVFALRATVTWTVTWAGGGVTGAVAPLTTTATLAVQVIEAPALNGSVAG